MSDIVERLRAPYDAKKGPALSQAWKLQQESADEIERLRDGYQEIAETTGLCVKPWTGLACHGCQCGVKNDAKSD